MKNKAFTLIELMVVILIVGILAAASVPLMRGRIDSAKWSEANATAGTIRSACRVLFVEKGAGAIPAGAMDATKMATLGFQAGDLSGTYFTFGDYSIGAADANGNVSVTVTSDGSGNKPTAGSRTLSQDGKTWQ